MSSVQIKFIRNFIFHLCVFAFLFLVTMLEDFKSLEEMYVFVFYFMFAINIIFFLSIREFLSREGSRRDLFFELLNVSFTGLSNIGLFAYIYYKFGVEGTEGIIVGDFASSLYFSIVTWTTLGYGDLKPIDDLRLLASLEAFMGYIYMAVLIGLFLNLFQVKTNK